MSPAIATRLVDSHCHLQADRFSTDAELVAGGARIAGVERIMVPGWNVASSRSAVALVERMPWLDAAVGIHPHDAARVSPDGWAEIETMAADPRVLAIGETGLDYDRQFSPVADQLENLRRNLDLALRIGKPAILHCRSAAGRSDAQEALVRELERAGIGGQASDTAFGDRAPAVIHSYSGPEDFARATLSMGLVLSISGLAFRGGEEATADAVRLAPLDRLLVETDSPFLAPPGAPRRRNEPEWVRITAGWVAQQRDEDPVTLGAALVGTYDRTFPRPTRTV